MTVANLMSILHSAVKLSLSSSSQYSAWWYAFGSIASAFPPALMNTSLRKQLLPCFCGSACSRMSFGQQPYDNTLWLSFSWRMCMNTPVLRPRLQQSCDVRALCDVELLLLQSTWEMLSTFACLRNHSSTPSFQLRMGSLPYPSEFRERRHFYSHIESHRKYSATCLFRSPRLILITDVSNLFRRILHCLNWQQHVCSFSLMSHNAPQTTNSAFTTVCRTSCFCSLLCGSCCGILIQLT